MVLVCSFFFFNCVFVFYCVLLFSTGRIVIDSGDSFPKPSIPPGLDKSNLETRQYYGAPCSGGRVCMPMSDCHQMSYEAAKSCYTGDQSMFCGGSGYEPYVCCPKSTLEYSQMCGKSLVSGQFYKGLGSFPFVARVGFKSK